ncbi:SH3 domain-containing protein [Amycolatopsis samaneae]|uniref:SH3b domain-containing protein n=1 Tax=Amycolatopsis samaneae TaxID=664691 RepID=A0ABW5GX89_9PSEU
MRFRDLVRARGPRSGRGALVVAFTALTLSAGLGATGYAAVAATDRTNAAELGSRQSFSSVTEPNSVSRPAPKARYTCVTGNNVRYRSGPGVRYKALGQVNRGQGVDIAGAAFDPTDGSYWDKVNLWGGPAGVWISMDFVGTCG